MEEAGLNFLHMQEAFLLSKTSGSGTVWPPIPRVAGFFPWAQSAQGVEMTTHN